MKLGKKCLFLVGNGAKIQSLEKDRKFPGYRVYVARLSICLVVISSLTLFAVAPIVYWVLLFSGLNV